MDLPPALRPIPPGGVPGPGRLGSPRAYAAAVALSVLAILSQYFVPDLLPGLAPVYGTLVGGLGIVYGIPLVAFAVLVGGRPLTRWSANSSVAAWEGIRWYGLLALLGAILAAVLIAVYTRFDPSALELLHRTNPVIVGARSNPWFFVAFSFVIGVVEELLFRGWIFGYWLARGTRNWVFHATWTSALFAGVHLYYGVTYAIASPILYPMLFLMGFAFAAAMRASGGNLWIVALLHGAHDAGSFLSIVSGTGSLAILAGLIVVGLLVALVDLIGSLVRSERGSSAGAGPHPPPPWEFGPPGSYPTPSQVLPPWALPPPPPPMGPSPPPSNPPPPPSSP